MGLQAEPSHAEAQGVPALQIAARAQAGPGLVLLAHADLDVLQAHVHALRGQRQQPLLQPRQQALGRSGCKQTAHMSPPFGPQAVPGHHIFSQTGSTRFPSIMYD